MFKFTALPSIITHQHLRRDRQALHFEEEA
jgi:hypothetical protein